MANSKESYHKYSHKDSSITTLLDFVTDGASIGHGLNVVDLVNFEDELGETNATKIFQLYSVTEESTYLPVTTNLTESNEEQIGALPLKVGTELALPLVKIDRELKKLDTNQVVDFRTFSQFISAQLYYMLRHPKYERKYKTTSEFKLNTIREIFPMLSVWAWSRNLSIDENGDYTDELIDITPFITNINVTSGPNGGNFTIGLPPITTDYVKESGWEIDKNMKFTSDGGFVSQGGFFKGTDKDMVQRNDFYFHRVLQENDLIFIRFEELNIETNRAESDKPFKISKDKLAGNFYDMIGLIDTNAISSTGANAQVEISITGRDLSKLFIDDGVYFYPFDYINDGIFANEDIGDRVERYDGQLKSRFQLGFKTIDNTFKFLFNALSNIQITSDTLFDSYANSQDLEDLEYKDRRSYKFYSSRAALLKKQEQIEGFEEEVKDIKELLEQSIGEEGVKDPPSVDAIYNQLYTFLEEAKKAGAISESTSKLSGWGAFTLGSEKITKDRLPSYFSNTLYKSQRVWRDGNGKIFNDAERIAFVKQLERNIKNIDLKVKQNLLNRDQIESMKDTIDKPERELTAEKSLQEFLNDALAENNAKAYARDNLPSDAAAATGGALYSDVQIEQKLQYELLQGQIYDLEQKGKSLKAVVIPKEYKELNDYAKEALQRIWDYQKQREVFNEAPAQDDLKLTKGIWQIVKLLVDDNVRNRRVVDSSIGNEQGSLMNAMRKIAQEPFVEMLLDTYGDQYYVTIRKPPFDKKGMLSMLEDQDVLIGRDPDAQKVNSQGGDLTRDFSNNLNTGPRFHTRPEIEDDNTVKSTLVMDIEDSDVISDQLSYGLTGQVYSWYRLTPQNLIAGQANDMAFAYLKAIYLKEYADIWGSKPLDLTTNYVPYFPVVDKNSKLPTAYFIKQGILDLKYMIESNAYNPFIRTGQITVIGNRLYKKGTFVRLKATNEIFYVEGVINNASINLNSVNRTTTLQVSRGMVEPFIKGVEINGTNYSYFNLVNTDIDENKFLQEDQGYQSSNKMLANWQVNKEVFNFFLKQKQFAHITNFIDLPPIQLIQGP